MTAERREALLLDIDRWTEWPQTILSLALIPILLIPHLFDVSHSTERILDDLDYFIWGLFVADLLVSVAVAPRRLQYLRTHPLDVVLVALPMLRPFRALRSFRAVRALAAGDRVVIGGRNLLARRGLHYVMISSLVIVVTFGALVTAFERDAPESTIRSFPDGLWWAVSTVTTVGYGDTYPTTGMGRGLGVALMIIGVGIFGVITANLSAFFIDANDDEMLNEVKELSVRIRELEATIKAAQTNQDL